MKVTEIDQRVKALRKKGATPAEMYAFWQSLSKHDNQMYLNWVKG